VRTDYLAILKSGQLLVRGRSKCDFSILERFWAECDTLAHENIIFNLWRFLSHPSRKTSNFGPAGAKLFWTGRNVTIRLGLKNVFFLPSQICHLSQKREAGRPFGLRPNLSLQHLFCRCIVFHRSLLLKNLQETQSLKSRWSSFPLLLNEFATLSFSGIERFIRLFCMNPWKLTQKVDRRKDTLKFSTADFSNLQTKSIDGQERPSNRPRMEKLHSDQPRTAGM